MEAGPKMINGGKTQKARGMKKSGLTERRKDKIERKEGSSGMS